MGGRGGSSHAAGGGPAARTSNPKLQMAAAALTSTFGGKHAQAMINLIEAAPALVRELWEDFGGNFGFAPLSPTNSKPYDAWYDPSDERIHFRMENGKSWVFEQSYAGPAYEVIFHEFGHLSSNQIAKGLSQFANDYANMYQGTLASGEPKLDMYALQSVSGALGDSLREELKEHIKRMKRPDEYAVSKSMAADRLINEIKNKYGADWRSYTPDISDMLVGAGIGIDYPLGVGHEHNYWDHMDVGIEAFAEMTAASIDNPKSLQAIKDYFPKSYNVYLEMLKARKKR